MSLVMPSRSHEGGGDLSGCFRSWKYSSSALACTRESALADDCVVSGRSWRVVGFVLVCIYSHLPDVRIDVFVPV